MLDPDHPIAELLARDDRYHFDAYVFVFEALRHAQQHLGMGTETFADPTDIEPADIAPADTGPADTGPLDVGPHDMGQLDDEDEPQRHVTGQELCEAMRLYAHNEYGYLAKSVLNHWGIYSTSDFGAVVFNLIEIEQMRKTPHDCREDFDDVFDFDEGFQHSFEFQLPDSSEERRS